MNIPDITNSSTASEIGTLDLVGMENISLPFNFCDLKNQPVLINATVDAFVNLNKEKAKGIHMSRLYLLLKNLSDEKKVTLESFEKLSYEFIKSHQELSNRAKIIISFDYLLEKESLKSGYTSWFNYPVTITIDNIAGKIKSSIHTTIYYSSTCPCSAALSRQILEKNIQQHFKNHKNISQEDLKKYFSTTKSLSATPHSQRSKAQIKYYLKEKNLCIKDLILASEDVLKTAVQGTVKREDEQEFARLNAANLMFCEDAARRLKNLLLKNNDLENFKIKVAHLESLHAHDAVAFASKD